MEYSIRSVSQQGKKVKDYQFYTAGSNFHLYDCFFVGIVVHYIVLK